MNSISFVVRLGTMGAGAKHRSVSAIIDRMTGKFFMPVNKEGLKPWTSWRSLEPHGVSAILHNSGHSILAMLPTPATVSR